VDREIAALLACAGLQMCSNVGYPKRLRQKEQWNFYSFIQIGYALEILVQLTNFNSLARSMDKGQVVFEI
jgi:hypothetical protein